MDEDTLAGRAERLDTYLDETGLEAVWFARPNSFAWLTGGSNVVSETAPVGVAAAGYDGSFRVVTDTIEGQRLVDEEVPDTFEVSETPWYEASLAEAVADESPTPAAADFDVSGFESVDPTSLRQPLAPRDVEKYRELGREAAAAVESVCQQLDPGDTEHEVASALRISLAGQGIDAPVALVGSGERAPKYRHFTPKDVELGSYAVVSVTAVRDGLHASLSRTVTFDPPEWLGERHEAATRVDATALASTLETARTDGTAADVFADVQAAYKTVGWEGEWEKHHQGGAAGFAGREWFASPTCDRPVEAPQGYAWNPTVRGAKSEDTVLVTEEGVEVLTATGQWPTTAVEAVGFEETVSRHLPLDL